MIVAKQVYMAPSEVVSGESVREDVEVFPLVRVVPMVTLPPPYTGDPFLVQDMLGGEGSPPTWLTTHTRVPLPPADAVAGDVMDTKGAVASACVIRGHMTHHIHGNLLRTHSAPPQQPQHMIGVVLR